MYMFLFIFIRKTLKSTEIADTFFCTDWYNIKDKRLKRLFIMVMTKCSKPIKISIAGVYDVNLMACMAVGIYFSYSLHSLLFAYIKSIHIY